MALRTKAGVLRSPDTETGGASLDPIAADPAPGAPDPVADVAAVAATPTIPEAEAIFVETPGLAWVLTDAGNLSRDGVLVPVATGE